jgi:hypothetical protein
MTRRHSHYWHTAVPFAAILATVILINRLHNITSKSTILQNNPFTNSDSTTIANDFTNFVLHHLYGTHDERQTPNLNSTISTNAYANLTQATNEHRTRQNSEMNASAGITLHNDRKREPIAENGAIFLDTKRRRKTLDTKILSISNWLSDRTTRISGGSDVTSATTFPYFSFAFTDTIW